MLRELARLPAALHAGGGGPAARAIADWLQAVLVLADAAAPSGGGGGGGGAADAASNADAAAIGKDNRIMLSIFSEGQIESRMSRIMLLILT